MEIRERIQLLMEQRNLTAAQFADRIGMQRSTLSHILNGRNNPSIDIISKIHEGYSDVSLDWLLFGEGSPSRGWTRSEPAEEPSLFDDENAVNGFGGLFGAENRKETELPETKVCPNSNSDVVKDGPMRHAPSSGIREQVPAGNRRIVQITVLYSDRTYDTFSPDRKG